MSETIVRLRSMPCSTPAKTKKRFHNCTLTAGPLVKIGIVPEILLLGIFINDYIRTISSNEISVNKNKILAMIVDFKIFHVDQNA